MTLLTIVTHHPLHMGKRSGVELFSIFYFLSSSIVLAVDSSPHAANMSCPRLARIVVIMPWLLR